jgi:hypothetical protein
MLPAFRQWSAAGDRWPVAGKKQSVAGGQLFMTARLESELAGGKLARHG